MQPLAIKKGGHLARLLYRQHYLSTSNLRQLIQLLEIKYRPIFAYILMPHIASSAYPYPALHPRFQRRHDILFGGKPSPASPSSTNLIMIGGPQVMATVLSGFGRHFF